MLFILAIGDVRLQLPGQVLPLRTFNVSAVPKLGSRIATLVATTRGSSALANLAYAYPRSKAS